MHNIFPKLWILSPLRHCSNVFQGKCQRIWLFCEVYVKLWRLCHFESSPRERNTSPESKNIGITERQDRSLKNIQRYRRGIIATNRYHHSSCHWRGNPFDVRSIVKDGGWFRFGILHVPEDFFIVVSKTSQELRMLSSVTINCQVR